jgi:catechol 2,3-dioxygenase
VVNDAMGDIGWKHLSSPPAENHPMSELPFAADAPIHVSRVGVRARDASALARFYQTVLGLAPLGHEDGAARLGAGGREILRIEGDRTAKPDDPRGAGLFHTAFLLPSRADLGRWIRHAAETGIRIDGASDHLVSEAIYLTDPEGNGVEIYADRPRDAWRWNGNQVEMATVRLDLAAVAGSVPPGEEMWRGAPAGTVVGHVHLRVGDAAQAEEWWRGTLGFDTVARYGKQAVFLSTGGYHHHIGANTWQSAGAGPRDASRAGLAWVELTGSGIEAASGYSDPWGTAIRAAPLPA